jgi:glucose-6-phosphate isomerase
VSEWWKQLYGESEGKNNKGIFPASVDFSTDLHSMGQWIQEGERIIFQTVLDVKKAQSLKIPSAADDGDGLNYLAGRELHEVNRVALMATMEAHASGGVPIARLILPEMDAWHLGGLMYMFEYACGISAYMLEVNPFDQPGVEAYKKNMFRMLGKPGS